MSGKRLIRNVFSAKMERPVTARQRCPGLTETRTEQGSAMTANAEQNTIPNDSALEQKAAPQDTWRPIGDAARALVERAARRIAGGDDAG